MNKNKKYSNEERKNYYQGISTAREDFIWCNGDKKKIKECIKDRKKMKQLCVKRKDLNGVSFQNGYLNYFNSKSI